MPISLSRTASVAVLALFAASCNGSDKEESADPYCPPVADAGPDQSIAFGAPVNLDGSLSGYPEGCLGGEDLTFQWVFESLPIESGLNDGALTDNNTTTASASSFTPDVNGTYVLGLSVCDSVGCSDTDVVIIQVAPTDPVPIAVAEVADGRTDFVVGTRVTLDGSGSYDPDGSPLTYAWSVSSVPACSTHVSNDVYDATTVRPSFVPDCEGTFVIALVVSDGQNYSEPDYVSLSAHSGNLPPVADAGPFAELAPCIEDYIPLNGFGSYDPEGEELSYRWSLVSAPANSTVSDANFSDRSVPDPRFHYDLVGAYSFQLEVFDGELWSAPDITEQSVRGIEDNTTPVANAGDDQTVQASGSCTYASYAWTCNNCAAQDADLEGAASYDPDGDDLTYLWSEPQGTLTIESPYSANTVVWTPASPATYNTTTTTSWTVTLAVADCTLQSTDTVTVSVACRGVQ